MKDIFCNAHYAPAYLYDPILHISNNEDLVFDRYSDRFEEQEDYYTFHYPKSYEGLSQQREYLRELFGCDTKESVFLPKNRAWYIPVVWKNLEEVEF